LLTSGVAGAVSYEGKGPFAVKTEQTPTNPVAKIAYPDGPGPFPVVILGHGFSASADNQIGWGEHFASYGFVALAPTLCQGFFCAPDATTGPGVVEAALAYLASDSAPAGVKGTVDVARFGLEGHSAGGQLMAVAAAQLKPSAIVLFDPVPGGQAANDLEPGKTANSQICGPLLTLFAENHQGFMSCNKTGAWKTFGLSSMGPRMGAIVKGSTHCDGENKPRPECGLVCGGGADATRQGRYAHYATAWFLGFLKNDPDALAEVAVAKLQADPLLHDAAGADGPNCAPISGAGGSAGGAGGEGGGAGSSGQSAAGEGGMAAAAGGAGPVAGEGGVGGEGATGGAPAAGGSEAAGGPGAVAGEGGSEGADGGSGGAGGGDGVSGGKSAGAGGVVPGASGASGGPGSSEVLADESTSSGGCGCRAAGQAGGSGWPSGGGWALIGLALSCCAAGGRRPRRPLA
jgi:dienelactone hydrolase